MTDFTVTSNDDHQRLNEFLTLLNEQARRDQEHMTSAYLGMGTGDPQYDQGYDAGRFGAGDDLETLLREYGFWNEAGQD